MPLNALIALNKPAHMTSHDCIATLRRILRERRIGHGGTLDPMATGVLVVGIGKATRLLEEITAQEKHYRARITFGTQTDTDDCEGEVLFTKDAPYALTQGTPLEAEQFVSELLSHFRGDLTQVPPAYSAIHVDGKRAYDIARSGTPFTLQERPITVYDISCIHIEQDDIAPFIDVELTVSKGTYIRSLARDMGIAAQSCAHLSQLSRISSGRISLSNTVTLADIEKHGLTDEMLLNPIRVLGLSTTDCLELSDTGYQKILQGQRLSPASIPEAFDQDSSHRLALLYQKRLVGLADVTARGIHARPVFSGGISIPALCVHQYLPSLSARTASDAHRLDGLGSPFEQNAHPEPLLGQAYALPCEADEQRLIEAAIKPLRAHRGRARMLINPPKTPLQNAVITIGAFDGVHMGHRFLIDQACADARKQGVPSVIVTFNIDPDEYFLEKDSQRKLLQNNERLSMLTQTGVDYVIVLPFNASLVAQDVETFFTKTLFSYVKPCSIHVGSDFRLGSGRSGDLTSIQQWARDHDIALIGHDLYAHDAAPITSTRVRSAIAWGDFKSATYLLGRPYALRGVVTHGKKLGRELGFPTANIQVDYPYQLPDTAVYAGYVILQSARDITAYAAALSMGDPVSPSVTARSALNAQSSVHAQEDELRDNHGVTDVLADEPQGYTRSRLIEAHLIDADLDLYGKQVQIIFTKRLRPMMTFASLDELRETVQGNIASVRASQTSCIAWHEPASHGVESHD